MQTKIVSQLQEKLSLPEIYGDTEKLLATTTQLHQAQETLDELETKWLELEMRLEESN